MSELEECFVSHSREVEDEQCVGAEGVYAVKSLVTATLPN